MRSLIWLLLAGAAVAQTGPRILTSRTTENLRGVSVVSRDVAWASGTHGAYLRTMDGGMNWSPAQVPDAAGLDFRAVVAFSPGQAFLMSAGPGALSRIYHTADGGKHWDLQFTNKHPKGFFDSMAFWDAKHGIVLGDPVADETGKMKFEILLTDDGQTWHPAPSAKMPEAIAGEGAFAASNSCIAIAEGPGSGQDVWFATGGKVARVFHSSDRGQSWEVFKTPILRGPDSAGISSIAFRDPLHGIIAGGDYKHPDDDGPNLAVTKDGGKTWTLSTLHPLAYFSAVAYDRAVNQAALRQQAEEKTEAAAGKKKRVRPVAPERILIVGHNFVFDFRPPRNPRRIGGAKDAPQFNALGMFPDGGALVVGPKGTIVLIP
jgi:photosystem II stability/assembly factor-like uncharacterized protein